MSYDRHGNTTYSISDADKQYVPWQIPCRKCLPCRLNTAAEKSIRCYHESKMHEHAIFLTLTYDSENLKSNKLEYPDFQNFMKALRKKTANKLSYVVTGEYGEINKRPHWHALIFGYWPNDYTKERTTPRGDNIYGSKTINTLWKKGQTEFGEVSIESANYVARYAAKKLVHGNDQDHDFHPIHKTSSRNAIGKQWIEKYWEQTFTHGYVTLPNGRRAKIPRYYEDWLKKHKPLNWKHYVTTKKPEIMENAEKMFQKELEQDKQNLINTGHHWKTKRRKDVKLKILNSKFKQLQEKLSL
jgi:phosphoribosyl-AMP cyclohydrolase